MISQLCIVGVGLIGGSIGLAARKFKVAKSIVGMGRRLETLENAVRAGAVDRITTEIADGVREADVVVVCTPVELIPEYVAEIAQHAKADCVITDAGSTKTRIVQECMAILKKAKHGCEFVGSHPMAGSEKNGVDHARAELFQGRPVIVTPSKSNSTRSINQVSQFWQSLGGKVSVMSAREHDQAVAVISHVPHVVATALAASTDNELLTLVAGGWLDTTRIAAADAELWRQILEDNQGHVLKALARFEKVLSSIRAALEEQQSAKLLRLLAAGKRTRDSVGS